MDRIEWKKYVNNKLGIAANIPINLQILEDSVDYVKLSNLDSGELINVVIAVRNISDLPMSIDTYYKQGESEILARGWGYRPQRDTVFPNGKKFYLNEYYVDTGNNSGFKMLHIYSALFNDKFVGITCRHNKADEALARMIFFYNTKLLC